MLEKLGKKPSTTHKDEGGTGMGFMNTFDTLRKCKASLTIEEFNKPGFTIELGKGNNPLPAEDTEKIYKRVKEMLTLCAVM